jgi:hypothetical protein
MSCSRKIPGIIAVDSRLGFTRIRFDGRAREDGRLLAPLPLELEHIAESSLKVAIHGKLVALALPWDSAFYVFAIRPGDVQPMAVSRVHPEPITAIAAQGSVVVTASTDCSCRISAVGTELVCKSVEQRRRTPVKCVAISGNLRMCVSVSFDGFAIASATHNGGFMAGIDLGQTDPSRVAISDFGFVVVAFNKAGCLIKVLDQNLVPITEKTIGGLVHAWKCVTWADGSECLLLAMQDQRLLLAALPFLEDPRLLIHLDFDVGHVEFHRDPATIVVGDIEGRIYPIPL